VEIYGIQKRVSKKAGVQYSGVLKNGVTERSTIYWRGEKYGRITDSI
jgi:hypothetical protein